MFEYISGNVTELSPTYTVVETNGIGYLLQISLQTYSQLKPETRVKLLIHEAIREDAHILYGFLVHTNGRCFVCLYPFRV